MKKQECFSLLSLAVTGMLCGGTQALAMPMVDSDLASSTVLGASMASKTSSSAIGGHVGDWSSGGGHAISGPDSSSDMAGLGTQMAGAMGHTDTPVAQLAQAPHPSATSHFEFPRHALAPMNPDLDGLIFPPGIDGVAVGPDIRSTTPDRDDAKIAKTDPCGTARTNPGAATLAQDSPSPNCKDNPAGNDDSKHATAPGGTIDVASLPTAPASKSGGGGIRDVPEGAATPGSPSDAAFLPLVLVSDDGVRSVPEAATLALLGIGLAGLGLSRRRSR